MRLPVGSDIAHRRGNTPQQTQALNGETAYKDSLRKKTPELPHAE